MNKISSLARMGIAHRCFGNPIPQAAYDLIEATEKCVEDFNPPNKLAEHAPELLEELQILVKYVIELENHYDFSSDVIVASAQAAIDKALGETK